jgi:hypothetical protein
MKFIEEYFNDNFQKLGHESMLKILMDPCGHILCDFAYDWDNKFCNMGWICTNGDSKEDKTMVMDLIKKAEIKAFDLKCVHMKVAWPLVERWQHRSVNECKRYYDLEGFNDAEVHDWDIYYPLEEFMWQEYGPMTYFLRIRKLIAD